MSGRREFDRASERHGLALNRFAFFHLLIGVWVLMAWTAVSGYLAGEVAATSRAAKGEGLAGTFTAHSLVCERYNCSWYGTFTTANLSGVTVEGVELRGNVGHSIDAGEMVSALDVGSSDFVQMRGGPPEWGLLHIPALLSFTLGLIATVVNARVLWGVYWTRASPESRKRQAKERGRPALRDLAAPDRWCWSARPGSAATRVKLARCKKRTLGATAGLLSLFGALLLFGLLWAEFNEETTRADLIAGLWAPLLAIILVGVTIQTLRLVLAPPRMWVTDDEIVIWDGLLLWKVLRIPRTAIAAIHYGDGPRRYPVEEDVAELTPFREELNLALEMRDPISLPARRLRWGNWFWVMLTLRNHVPQTGMPQRGHLVRRLRLRVQEPRRMATYLDRWLGGDETPSPPPEFAPVDHAHYGMVRTHSGVGDKRIKLKGQLPQPILAEFVNEGPGALRAWLRRTEFGHGPPVMVCGPKAPPATTVLDDRLVSDKPLTKRFLYVESEGPWTVTISGPERAREFTGTATGSGPEVLAYRGPAGIAVLTSAGRQSHKVQLHDPNLTALNNGDPVVSTTALPGADPPPTRSTFAVPAQAVIQVTTAGTDWRIEVTPLADADPLAQDAITAPPTGHVRPFEHSITGHNTAVVRYLGPPGPVLFHSGYAFGLLQLATTLTPLRTLALPSGNQKLRLRSDTLLQITGAEGTWSMEEAHPTDLAAADH